MQAVKSCNTTPEQIAQSLLHRLGYRFALHRADIPGKPDIVMPARCCIVFVHGCFWHMHTCQHARVAPKTNSAYWEKKRRGNAERDRFTLRRLRRDGWRVLTVWECQTKDAARLTSRIEKFLGK
jgi:DNA mismatch endonuclease (patch repair protein)